MVPDQSEVLLCEVGRHLNLLVDVFSRHHTLIFQVVQMECYVVVECDLLRLVSISVFFRNVFEMWKLSWVGVVNRFVDGEGWLAF